MKTTVYIHFMPTTQQKTISRYQFIIQSMKKSQKGIDFSGPAVQLYSLLVSLFVN